MSIPHPGWLGFVFSYKPERGPAGKSKDHGFLIIHNVLKGSPAAKAGLRVNDLVTEIDGLPVYLPDAKHVVAFFSRVKVGETMGLTVNRSGKTLQYTLKAAPMPPSHVKGWEALWRSVHG